MGGGVWGFFKLPCAVCVDSTVHDVSLPPATVSSLAIHVFVSFIHSPTQFRSDSDAASAVPVPNAVHANPAASAMPTSLA